MGYFQVRYNSSLVNYDPRSFIILATGISTTPDPIEGEDGVKLLFRYSISMASRFVFNGEL